MNSGSDKASRFLAHLESLQGALQTYCHRRLNDPDEVADTLQTTVAETTDHTVPLR